MSHRRAILAAAVVCGLATLALPETTGSAAPASTTTKPHTGRESRTIGNLTVTYGPYDPPRVPDKLASTALAAAGLVDYNDSELAGSWYDASTGRLVLETASPRGQELAAAFSSGRASVTVRAAAMSQSALLDEARGLVARSPELSSVVTMLGADPDGSGIFVEVNDWNSTYESSVAKEVSDLTFPVVVRVGGDKLLPGPAFDEDRQHDLSPYSGGFGYLIGTASTAGPQCSGGFGYLLSGNESILTAGHCYRNGTSNDYMWSPLGPWSAPTGVAQVAGKFQGRTSMNADFSSKTTSDGLYHGDVALVNNTFVARSAGNQIWKGGPGTTNKSPVVTRSAPAIGVYICIGGATTGETCGDFKITNTNVDLFVGGVWVRQIDTAKNTATSGCSEGGDSGGSVYRVRTATTTEAIGIISGHSDIAGGGCQQRFTGVEEAIQAWGGELQYY